MARQIQELLDKRMSEIEKEREKIQKLRKRTGIALSRAMAETQIAVAHSNAYAPVVPDPRNSSVDELTALLRAAPSLGTTKMNAVENEMKRLGF